MQQVTRMAARELLTETEAAAQMRRAPATIKRWRRLRKGPPYVRIMGRVLYDPALIEKWLANSVCGEAA